MGWWGGGGPCDFSVTPVPIGLGFLTGLGLGLGQLDLGLGLDNLTPVTTHWFDPYILVLLLQKYFSGRSFFDLHGFLGQSA